MANETGAGNWVDAYRSSVDTLKEKTGIPANARNFGEIMAHMAAGKPGQFYHRFLETPMGEQEAATFTEADYDPEHLEVMRDMARLAKERGRYHTSADKEEDYLEILRRQQGLDTTPGYVPQFRPGTALWDVGTTLGGYQFDVRDGNVYATDQYDFNQYDLSPEHEDILGLGGPGTESTSAELDAAMKKADFSWSDLRVLAGDPPYTQENLKNALDKMGWTTERKFPWWDSFQKRALGWPFGSEKNFGEAGLGRLHSPPFEETSIPVDVNLGTIGEVYGPLHRGYRPQKGIIGR
jgi:hypothetical protein